MRTEEANLPLELQAPKKIESCKFFSLGRTKKLKNFKTTCVKTILPSDFTQHYRKCTLCIRNAMYSSRSF